MTRIAILGPGAVGGLLAALLQRAGEDVLLIGRDGLGPVARVAVRSPRFGDVEVAVPAAARLEAGDGDVLVVAVKAPALDDALTRIAGEPAAVVPLLNGVEHVEALRGRFGARVVAGVVRVQAHREQDGDRRLVVHRAPFLDVALAAPGCPPLEDALQAAGAGVASGAAEADVLWGKLSRLAALGLATAAAGRPLGDVRDDARAAAREVAAVARAEGAAIEAGRVIAELDGLPDAASSSLRADVDAGVRDELDAIGGAVLRAGARHGLDCPVVRGLVAGVEARREAR